MHLTVDDKTVFFDLNCGRLLVPSEKLVPLCGFGRYPSNQQFWRTEIQPHSDSARNLTKASWVITFKSDGLLIFGTQEEINGFRKSKEQI